MNARRTRRWTGPRSSDGVGGRCQPGVRLPMQLISSVNRPPFPLSHALRQRPNHPPWAGPSFLRRDKSSLPIASVYCHSEPPATREPTLQRNPVCQCAKKPLRVKVAASDGLPTQPIDLLNLALSVLNPADSRPADRIRRYAAELAALAPDVIVATGSATLGPVAAGKPFRAPITVPKTKAC